MISIKSVLSLLALTTLMTGCAVYPVPHTVVTVEQTLVLKPQCTEYSRTTQDRRVIIERICTPYARPRDHGHWRLHNEQLILVPPLRY